MLVVQFWAFILFGSAAVVRQKAGRVGQVARLNAEALTRSFACSGTLASVRSGLFWSSWSCGIAMTIVLAVATATMACQRLAQRCGIGSRISTFDRCLMYGRSWCCWLLLASRAQLGHLFPHGDLFLELSHNALFVHHNLHLWSTFQFEF